MPSRRTRYSVDRKIYFFRADVGIDDGGLPLAFDPKPALAVIDQLPFVDGDSGRYQTDRNGNALCLVNHHDRGDICIRFGRIRRSGLPQIEQAGRIRDLSVAADEGLSEPIHVVAFPDNVVGVDYNHFGPRISQFARYLHSKSNRAIPEVTFHALLRNDAARQLDRLGEIRVLDISISPSYVEQVKRADRSLGDALAANAEVIDRPRTVQLTIKSNRRSRRRALDKLLRPLKSMAAEAEFFQKTDRLQVRGRCVDTNRVETIDLLKDKLISTKRILRLTSRGRALDPDSAFQAIFESYDDLVDDIYSAPGMS